MRPPILLATLLTTLLLSASTAQTEVRVLLLPQDNADNLARELRFQDFVEVDVTVMSGQLADIDPQLLIPFDAVIVWTNDPLDDDAAARAGDMLADYVDGGGGVVEMVFSQFAPGQDIEGRWSAEDYALVHPTSQGLFGGGQLGEVENPGHPVMDGVASFFTQSNRTGDTTLRPGAELIASYTDGQILVATREDKPGRVVWLGFLPSIPFQNNGDWLLMVVQALDWSATRFRASAGSTYTAVEGAQTILLDATGSRGEIESHAWDLDGDGEYDDADTATVDYDVSAVDGPFETTVAVRVTGPGPLVATDDATIQILNAAPRIVSEPPNEAVVGLPYIYPIEVEDPAGPLDPPTFEIREAPEGVQISPEGSLTWTPTLAQYLNEFRIRVLVDDGDNAVDEQLWRVRVTGEDTDQDLLPDTLDNCPEAINPEQLDTDGDGEGDECDRDDDADTIADDRDNCRLVQNPDQRDNDGDGPGDACDADDDNDFVPDEEDNCPTVTNPDQRDLDSDGVGDICQFDRDEDAIEDDDDNCPDAPNTNQEDNDRDGQGDVCDPDDDNDTLSDADEIAQGSDPFRSDTDNDGLDDAEERDLSTDPNLPDSDSDGLGDLEEAREHLTDPNESDTDRGGVGDGEEHNRGTDPLDASDDFPPEPEPEPDAEPDPEPTPPKTPKDGCQQSPGTPSGAMWWWFMLALSACARRALRTRRSHPG